MNLKNQAMAGSLESSDVLVSVSPLEGEVQVEIQSVVYEQFGKELEETVLDVLKQFNVNNVKIMLNDRGALECTVRARVETALKRAGLEGEKC